MSSARAPSFESLADRESFIVKMTIEQKYPAMPWGLAKYPPDYFEELVILFLVSSSLAPLHLASASRALSVFGCDLRLSACENRRFEFFKSIASQGNLLRLTQRS